LSSTAQTFEKQRKERERESETKKEKEKEGRKVFYISPDVASSAEYIDCVTLWFLGEKLNSRPREGFDVSQT